MSIPSPQQRLRVAVVTNYFPTSAQPWAGHSAYQTLLKLAERCDVEVFYPEATYPEVLRPKSRTYTSIDLGHVVPGFKTHYLPFRALPYVSRPLNGWAAAKAVYAAVRNFAPHVILSYVIYPDGFAAVRIAKSLGVPAVITAIGSDLNRISGSLVHHLTRRTLQHAAAVITVSGDLLATARRLGAPSNRSVAILNGCDTTMFYPQDRSVARTALNIPQTRPVVLYVGRLDVRKGLVELIEAFAELQSRKPNIHCYLVGDGSDRALLNEIITRSGMTSHITLVPSCPTERVATWIAASNLLTLPSYKEGCPNVVLEALCSGRPVVATNVGGIPELMDHRSGALIQPHTMKPLSTALEEVLSNKWDADSLAGRHHRSWKDVSEDLFEVLKRAAVRV